ncbi:MAG: tetratricopeptide repeat protein, partial [Gemmatimonadaceae bacterium]
VTTAIGEIEDFTRAPTSASAAPALPAMLATTLGSVQGLHVVSRARWFEIAAELRAARGREASAREIARDVGAGEMLEGALYARGPDSLELDLRRVDVATGDVRAAFTVAGRDAPALARAAAAELARRVSGAPARGVADLSTTSIAAVRLYEEGLRAFYRTGCMSSLALFRAAIAEDSSFAMPTYYASRCTSGRESLELLRGALARSARAPDRDRLLIRYAWADVTNDPARLTIAETLAARFPDDSQGRLALAWSLLWGGRHLESVPHFERVIALDSLSLRPGAWQCTSCEAYGGVLSAYMSVDSFVPAIRVAGDFVRARPSTQAAWDSYAYALDVLGRTAEAEAALRMRGKVIPDVTESDDAWARHALRLGRFADADRIVQTLLDAGSEAEQARARWLQVISLRDQGRMREALEAARALADVSRRTSDETELRKRLFDQPVAQVMFELGDWRESAAISEAIAPPGRIAGSPGGDARWRVWQMTHRAAALAELADTMSLQRLADSLELLGARSAYGRDRLLHFHVRGLLAMRRGRLDEAIDDFRRAIFSPVSGYTRTNLELARALRRRNRAAEAVPWLRAALHAAPDASAYYVTQTELQEELALAFDAAGARDSAVTYYERVSQAWAHGDPDFQKRATSARARAAALHVAPR